jgi:poly(3-hydroxybutyrate) depolymerase
LFLLATPCLAQESLTSPEVQARAAVAKEWLKLGKWCVRNHLGSEARQAAELAQEAAPEGVSVGGLERFLEDAAACVDEANERSREKAADKREASGEKVAKLYERLASLAPRQDDAVVRGRLRGYLIDALTHAPTSKRWARLLEAIAAERDAGGTDVAVALAERAQALEPPEQVADALAAAVDLAAVDAVVLRQASTHAMRYYFSLPRGYAREARRWPVLVCVDGAGSNFEGMARGYAKARGDLPFLVVSPCSFANTNRVQGKLRERYAGWYDDATIEAANRSPLDWDDAGLQAVLAELRERYRTEERVYVTGFSGGGNLTYTWILRHPEQVQAAAPACANFNRGYYGGLPDVDTDALRFPVHLITGAEDPHRDFTFGDENIPGIEPQTDQAEALLRERGYPHVKRTLVPGLKHSAAREQVLDTFRPYLLGEKSRGDPLE